MRKTKSSGPVRYAIYSRCSSDDQAHKDFSTTDVQRGLNEQHVSAQGGVIAGTYKDEGISGTTLKRPDWKRLLSDAQAGRFDVVLVTYMSRLGRGEVFTVAEYLLKEAGVKVEMVKEVFTEDVSGFINKQMTQFVDGMYVEQVRQWTKTKMEAMVKAGYFAGGVPAFGFTKEFVTDAAGFHTRSQDPPKRLVPHPENAEIARHAFSVYMDRGTIAAVRDYLNSVTARHWTTTNTKALLKNETYIGVQQFGQWRNEASHAPLVDRETWQRVQDGLKDIRPQAAPRSDGFNYYLRGLLHCPHCGCVYTSWPAKGGTVAYYGCLRSQKGHTTCPVSRINANALHKVRAQVSNRRQFLGVQIKNLTEAIANGSSSFRSIMTSLEAKEKERDGLDMEIKKLDEEIRLNTLDRPEAKDVQSYWAEFAELWPELTEEEKREMIGYVVKRVEVKEKGRIFLELNPIGGKCGLSHGAKFLTSKKWERVFAAA